MELTPLVAGGESFTVDYDIDYDPDGNYMWTQYLQNTQASTWEYIQGTKFTIDEAGLYGSIERIEKRWEAWADSGITGFNVTTHQDEALQLMADIVGTGRGT